VVALFDFEDTPFFSGQQVTASEATAYSTASAKPAGNRTAQEQQTIASVEGKVSTLSAGWSAYQAAAAAEILTRTARVQAELSEQIRKSAKPGRERALLEMFSVLTKANADLLRDLVELRGRLDASPY